MGAITVDASGASGSAFGGGIGDRPAAASVLQASAFRSDVTVFRLNATTEVQSGSEPAFGRNTAERVYTIEVAHNPEVAGSNPAPAMDPLATRL